MAEQLVFDLPVRAALAREDFFVAPANSAALAAIEGWKDWAGGKLVLTGPAASGKTHLAHVWAAMAGAQVVPATGLAARDIPELAAHHRVAVEDAPSIAGNPEEEAALFHLHNLTLAEGGSLLLTGTGAPNTWNIALPDLASRIAGTGMVALAAPDDALLAALLMKQFADRQLSVSPRLLPYLIRRMERSFDGARDLVARLDQQALAEGRRITLDLAAKVLDNQGPDDA